MSAAVSVVIVAYRSRDVIERALRPLAPLHREGALDCLIVDNGGGDDLGRRLREVHPWVEVIEAGENLGFGRAANVGARVSRGRDLLFLNPDATIGAESLRRLREVLAGRPAAAAVVPAVRNGDGRSEVARRFPTPASVVAESLGRRLAPRSRAHVITPGAAPLRVDWGSGAVLLVRRTAFEDLGGFDERFFLYFEDVDLQRRARSRGWEVWAAGEATAEHDGAHSARAAGGELYCGCLARHYFASRFYYLEKHHGRSAASAAELAEYGLSLLRAAARRARGRAGDRELRVRLGMPLLRRPGAGGTGRARGERDRRAA